jgi:hypothetical protein
LRGFFWPSAAPPEIEFCRNMAGSDIFSIDLGIAAPRPGGATYSFEPILDWQNKTIC